MSHSSACVIKRQTGLLIGSVGVMGLSRFVGLILAIGTGIPAGVVAQTSQLPFGECRSGYWSSNRNLDDARQGSSSACLIDWKARATEGTRAAANLRISHGVRDEPHAVSARLREAYVEQDIGHMTMRFGRQLIVWGRSDRISPTDVLGARDFTHRNGDDDAQRQGTDVLSLRWHVKPEYSVTALAARFEPDRIPQGQLPANRVEGSAPTRAELAMRLDRAGEGLDASLTLFDGFDKARRFWFGSGQFQSTHERIRMLGADAATSTGRWTMRGEVAHVRTRPDCGDCGLEGRGIQRAVLGVDRDILESANINLQLFGVRRTGYQTFDNQPASLQTLAQGLDRLNSEFGRIERGATLRYSDRFLNDRLKAEVSGLFDLTHGSRLIRGRVTHALTDRLRVHAGFDRFSGPPQTFFGSRTRNNAGWIEIGLVF